MKVLQVLLRKTIGGAESFALSLENEFNSREGIESTTIYLDDPPLGSRIAKLARLRRRLREQAPDLIISHSALPNAYVRFATRRIRSIAVLHSASDDYASRMWRFVERLVVHRRTSVVAVSQRQAHDYHKRLRRLPVPKVIPNGIPAPDVAPTIASAPPFRFVTVARVASQKNPALWLETARILAESDIDAQFEWWGPLPTDSATQELVAQNTTPRVTFKGPTHEPFATFSSGTIAFHPADREAHSVSLLEAASVGRPIVCSSAVAATLPPELPSATFATGDPASAAAALREVVENWPAAATLALTAAVSVRARFGIATCADQYLQVANLLMGDTE